MPIPINSGANARIWHDGMPRFVTVGNPSKGSALRPGDRGHVRTGYLGWRIQTSSVGTALETLRWRRASGA